MLYTPVTTSSCRVSVSTFPFGRKRHFDGTKCVNTEDQGHRIQQGIHCNNNIHSDTSNRFTNNATRSGSSSSSILGKKSVKISKCQSSMWYLHRMIVVVTLWIMCGCSSEAFASRSNNSFFGRKLGRAGYFRGGSSSTSSASGTSSTTTTTSTKSVSDSSTSTLTCVMQAPPRITSIINGGFNSDDNNYNEKKRKNGVEQPSSVLPNGAAFYRPIRQRDDSLMTDEKRGPNPNASVQDVITAAVHVAETKLPTDIGQFQLRAYRIPESNTNNNNKNSRNNNNNNNNNYPDTTTMAQQEPCVIYSRDKPPFGNDTHFAQHVPVRIHDQCLTSEVFGSQRCDCKEQLYMALQYITKHGGCIIYLQQEGRGIGLANKIAAYALQDSGFDTVDANLHLGFPEDNRVYGVVPSILEDMKIGSIQLMTNNPRKVERLERVGVNVERTLPMVVAKTNQYNYRYMETKQNRMNHINLKNLLSLEPDDTTTTTTTTTVPRNGLMLPRKSIAVQYINNGTEMSANAVQVSLMVDKDDEMIDSSDEQQEGVLASDDGYCFGKQSVLDAIDAVRRGQMVVVVDDMNRENEGDFIMAADQCTALDMAQIVRYSSGVVCIAMKGDRMDELHLPPMCVTNEDPKGTAFSVTVDATKKHGITTGISASDRATTVRLLADPSTTAVDFHRPGHIFPLRARDGGVLERDGHTEAAVDLARLAGHASAGILCEIVSEDNPTEMMRLPEMKRFVKQHGFVMTSIVDLIQYRRETGL